MSIAIGVCVFVAYFLVGLVVLVCAYALSSWTVLGLDEDMFAIPLVFIVTWPIYVTAFIVGLVALGMNEVGKKALGLVWWKR